jgi:hypothetical protein
MSDPNAPAPRGLLNWWQGLILAISSAIIGVVAAVAVMSPGAGLNGGPSWAMILLRFVPHFLLLFGVLADAFTYEGVYWTGTMVGVLATFVAPFLDMVAGGAAGALAKLRGARATGVSPTSALGGQRGGADYEGCSLMNGGIGNKDGVPQTLTVTASILSYYIFDLALNLSLLDAAGAIAAALILFGGQVVAISDCVTSPAMAAIFSGSYGILIGGVAFWGISTWGPKYLPSTVLSGSGGPGGRGLGGFGGGLMDLSDPNSAAQSDGAVARTARCPQ